MSWRCPFLLDSWVYMSLLYLPLESLFVYYEMADKSQGKIHLIPFSEALTIG